MTSPIYNNPLNSGALWNMTAHLTSHMNLTLNNNNDTSAHDLDLNDPHPTSSSSSSEKWNVLDLNGSYTVVIIILSLLVVITILFTLCSLFMKAVAHSRPDVNGPRGAGIGDGGLLFSSDEKDSNYSAFTFYDDI